MSPTLRGSAEDASLVPATNAWRSTAEPRRSGAPTARSRSSSSGPTTRKRRGLCRRRPRARRLGALREHPGVPSRPRPRCGSRRQARPPPVTRCGSRGASGLLLGARAHPDVDVAVRGVTIDLRQLVGREVEPVDGAQRVLELGDARARRSASTSSADRAASTQGRAARAICPRPAASSLSPRTLARVSLGQHRRRQRRVARRRATPRGIPSRYLSVSMPCASGEKPMQPTPELAERVEKLRPRSTGSAVSTTAGG